MTTGFRALCAELLEAIEPHLMFRHLNAAARIRTADRLNSVLYRARAALAEQSVGPTDEDAAELIALIRAYSSVEPVMGTSRVLNESAFGAVARAVLARWGNLAAEPDSSRLHGAD